MTPRRSPTPAEMVLLLLLGLAGLTGLLGALCTLIPSTEGTGPVAPQLIPLCLGPAVASLGAVAMIWLRNRARPAWPPLVAALALWSLGVTVLGLGGTAVFLNDEPREFLSNLGFAAALCLAPGAVLTLLGLALYAYSRRGLGPSI